MSDLLDNLTEFCHLLRRSGLPVGPGDSLEALRALGALDIGDRSSVYLGLRTVLIRRVEDFSLYETAFCTFFDGRPPTQGERSPDGRQGAEGEEATGGRTGSSPREVMLEQDLGALDRAGQADAARSAFLVARRLALRLSRRRRLARRAERINLRATVRAGVRRGGTVLELIRSRRRRKPANLVLLLDVSGSMEPYSRFLLQFVHALQSGLPRTQTFVFSTQLSRVSDQMAEHAFAVAVQRARSSLPGWGGGTRIGASLTQFCETWAPGLLGPRTAVIILSDGLETGEPDLVRSSLARIASRSARVIWLNPLAGDPRYQPLARGMAAALPYLDILAPGHSLGSLLAMEKHLEGSL